METRKAHRVAMIPHFTYPWALLLLLLIPGLGWLSWRNRRASWIFSDHRLFPVRAGQRAVWARWGGIAFRLTVLALLIVSLSGPRWVDERERIPMEGLSIAMVLDVSVSMSEQDFAIGNEKTSRLEGVQRLFRLFVAGGKTLDGQELLGRGNDLVGLVTFATHPETACPLTLDHAALLKIMDEQKPRSAAGEGTTNPGDALAWALGLLKDAPTQRKVLVFLTDGEINERKKLMPRQAAQLAANLSIPIYAIDAAPEPKNAKEAEELEKARASMQTIARMTDGQYFRAQDGRGLVQAYESIDRLERSRILSFQYRQYLEGYHVFALLACGAWMMLLLLEATRWRTAP